MQRRLLVALVVIATSALGAIAADRKTLPHPIVPGFERFHADEKADAVQGGQLLLGELGCVACHVTQAPISRKQGPILDKVAERVRISYLTRFLADPQKVKPGTTMPNLLAGDAAKDKKVEALVHFLASTGSLKKEPPRRQFVESGRTIYHRVGCVACHGSRDAEGNAETTLSSSVPLGDLKTKYTITTLREFLQNPHQVRPSGRMPMLLHGNEARDVTNYLLQGIKFDLAKDKGATHYSYYEGNWPKMPDFDKLKPIATGHTVGFDLGVARRPNNYGVKYEGFIEIKNDARFTFTLNSDDGSQLFVDGAKVVDNDGVHGTQARNGSVDLKQGIHAIKVLFFQGPGGAVLEASIQAPGLGNRKLGDVIAPTREALAKKPPKEKPKEPDFLDIDKTLVAKGRKLFTSMGCANCHQMKQGGKALASELGAPELDKIKHGGCLGESSGPGLPWFALSARQRQSLKAALQMPVEISPAPNDVVTRTMTTFNCYACHSLGKIGGPDSELDKFFTTTQPEMGDEGRVPPPLDGVGAKLKSDYFKQILNQGADDRPYAGCRMPGFGDANVGHLVQAFDKLDTLPNVAPIKFQQTSGRVKSVGRHLIGEKAFSCYKCHTFKGQKAEGVQGIDMILMPKRLRRDWFHAYVSDPQTVRPGTRMPSAFINGKSVLPKILDGSDKQQIEAMWLYLSDGTRAQLPLGLRTNSMPLIPEKTAIIYRNFIQGAGTRAIAVGYPERAHLAWDANEMCLAMIWQGEFIDARRHWTGRGQGFEGPLGDNVMSLPRGPTFAFLASNDAAWPKTAPKELGYKFRGYRLTADDRPTFLYSFKDATIEDSPNAAHDKQPVIRRTLTVKSEKAVENLYFRAAVASSIVAGDNGAYRIDDAWTMKIESEAKPVIRTSNEKKELLVPVQLSKGAAKITQTYVW